MLLKGAKFEAELAGGVALWDVVDLLPRHASKRYAQRPVSGIERVYVHHSGALGKPGFEGARASAAYSIREDSYPGAAYHYWIPAEPLVDLEERLVVLRLNHDGTRSFHTGSPAGTPNPPNAHGVGVCLQGNTTEAPLTARVKLALGRPAEIHARCLNELEAQACRAAALALDGPVEWSSDLRLMSSIFSVCEQIEYLPVQDAWRLTPRAQRAPAAEAEA